MHHIEAFWHPHPSRVENSYVAFQATLKAERAGSYSFHLFGCDLYRVYCAGKEVWEGPSRFADGYPEYDVFTLELEEGEHALAILAHYYGVPTRITSNKLRPFVQIEVSGPAGVVPLVWSCREIEAYLPTGRRINAQLGWSELCDTRRLPEWLCSRGRQEVAFATEAVAHPPQDSVGLAAKSASESASAWLPVAVVNPWEGQPEPVYRPASVAACRSLEVEAALVGKGVFDERFGYEQDDPPVRFMLRKLEAYGDGADGADGADVADGAVAGMHRHGDNGQGEIVHSDSGHDASGVWYRFDLGKVGLYRPVFTIEVPAGTAVIAGYSEYLTDERVAPVITLSASPSCHLDQWIARGGAQTFTTFSPRGFRYLEIHVAAPAGKVALHEAYGLQRTYFAAPVGSFASSDPLLDQIWAMGVTTLQSCSEDALTDTPTRERGQWLGDAVAVGMETLSIGFGDLALIRRSLEQAAQCSQPDGMIAGCYPGQVIPVSSFAMLWVSGCVRYYGLTGDLAFLQSQYEPANKAVDLFLSFLGERGIAGFPYWDFVDWGHHIEPGETNVALHVLLWKVLRDMVDWSAVLGDEGRCRARSEQRDRLEALIRKHMLAANGLLRQAIPAGGGTNAAALADHTMNADNTDRTDAVALLDNSTGEDSGAGEPGYHANVLALRYGLFREEERQAAVAHIKRHMLNCFPNNAAAPRLSDPGADDPQLITPYFGHYALAALLEAGEADFVLEQYRICWGWMIRQGAATLLEVFDHRWSYCHAWSGCPSWQLSRYMLGLHPLGEGDPHAFELRLQPGTLTEAAGVVPIVGTDAAIRIAWQRQGDSIVYTCDSDLDIRIGIPEQLPYRIEWGQDRQDGEFSSAGSAPFAGKSFRATIYL